MTLAGDFPSRRFAPAHHESVHHPAVCACVREHAQHRPEAFRCHIELPLRIAESARLSGGIGAHNSPSRRSSLIERALRQASRAPRSAKLPGGAYCSRANRLSCAREQISRRHAAREDDSCSWSHRGRMYLATRQAHQYPSEVVHCRQSRIREFLNNPLPALDREQGKPICTPTSTLGHAIG